MYESPFLEALAPPYSSLPSTEVRGIQAALPWAVSVQSDLPQTACSCRVPLEKMTLSPISRFVQPG